MPHTRRRAGFTLVELLVVIAVIAVLIAILLPALAASKQRARGVKCVTQLRAIGQGLVMYTQDHGDVLVPGRLPEVDNCYWYADFPQGRKYRPTFLAMMGREVGLPAFDYPAACKSDTDEFGQAGNRQNYSNPIYVCPQVPDWTDERNGSYGYNYQFLGNSRLFDVADVYSFKNWPVLITRIRTPGAVVAVADSMGTAASFAPAERLPYDNNGSGEAIMGNEGFNLDPPRVTAEMASAPYRTSVDPRHLGKSTVLWVDGHAELQTPANLGYKFDAEGRCLQEGDNSLWSGIGKDVPWEPGYGF